MKAKAKALDYLDAIGISIFCHPMSTVHSSVHKFELLNFFDDMGIFLVCKPLRYLHRFAAFLLDVDLDADSEIDS
jgi:hypothetical protein